MILLFLRFNTSKVTLSGFAGGEYLPLPASKGPAFPFLLTLDGYPTSPADYAQKQQYPPEKSPETPGPLALTFRGDLLYRTKNYSLGSISRFKAILRH